MKKIIYQLKSINFDVNNNQSKLFKEITDLGGEKILLLAKYTNNINDATKLVVADFRISAFFWKHIRRLEINAKAILINYFIEEATTSNKLKIIISKNKFNREFAARFLKYDMHNDNEKNKKTAKSLNWIISSYIKQNTSKGIIEFIQKISLGKLMDFILLLDEEKVSCYKDIKKYFKLSNLVGLRNKISHFHLLCKSYSRTDLIMLWETILEISEVNEKTKKNILIFNKFIKEFNI